MTLPLIPVIEDAKTPLELFFKQQAVAESMVKVAYGLYTRPGLALADKL